MSRPNLPDRPNTESAPDSSATATQKRKITLLRLKSPVKATEERLFRIDKERIVIGSMVAAEVQLTGDGVAPIHAVLEVTHRETAQARAIIYDLASDGGLRVNDQKVVAEELKPGDRISIGKHQLIFEFEERKVGSGADRYRTGEGRDLFFNPKEDVSPLLLENLNDVVEIFDYHNASQLGLQVTMSWFDTILDVQHFVRESRVTVGTSKGSDFAIPPLLGPKAYSIVSRSEQGYTLHLEAAMSGVLQRDGKLQSLDEVRLEATRGPTGNTILLKNGDFAKISIGDVDFYFAFTPSPPRLRRRGQHEKDPLYWRILLGSMALTGAMIFALLNARVPVSLEAEKIPERIATILYQPENFPPKPEPRVKVERRDEVEPQVKTPQPEPTKKAEPRKVDLSNSSGKPLKEVPKVMTSSRPQAKATAKAKADSTKANSRTENQAKEGEGARAKGRTGTRGSPKAAPGKTPQDRANRPSATPGKGRGGGQSQVADDGNVDFLKGAGAKISNILAGSSARLGTPGDRLSGFGNFATQGGGGLALSGDGKGGGGNAASLGGLGKKGSGGGAVGTGRGAIGSGSGIIGGEARLPPIRKGGVEEAVVVGAIDKDAIEAALLAHKDEFRLCYEREINAERPNLAGRVGVTFVIGSTGRVTQAGVESSSLKSQPVERCVVLVIKRIAFPVPLGGGIVQVTKGFKFDPLRAGG